MRRFPVAKLGLAFVCLSLGPHVVQGKIDITCDALDDGQIDWDCIFGPESLEEVHDRGGTFTTCTSPNSKRPCSRFIVKKEAERSEVKVQEGPEGFPFLKNEKYIFKYSFRAVDGMKVATRFTHLGQIKGSKEGYMIKGDPLYSLTANKYGLMVRFSNLDSIEDFHPGFDDYLKWEDATGDWVNVKITTVFGQSMEVELSGAVKGTAVWPKNLSPVAWHRDSEMARMKLGLYHKHGEVADGEVEYRDISIEGPNGIIRTTPSGSNGDGGTRSPSPSPSPSPKNSETCSGSDQCDVDITCDALEDNQIDWDCIFGPDSLEEVHQRGGKFTTCPRAKNSRHPCSLFVVKKDEERSEVKVQEGPEGFPFLKDEKYVFRYSFRAKEGMKVAKRFTHLGQLKGSKGGYMIKGDPIYSLTANNDGLMVRFSNLESIDDYHPGFEKHLNWNDATGQWVHVKITTVFGQSMKVKVTGAVEGEAVWPDNLKPIAWHRDAEMVRMKLGLYHKTDQVADGEVEFRNIFIEGPNGKIRTTPRREPSGSLYRGCFEDDANDRVLKKAKYVDAHMTTEMCEDLCEGAEYFGTQFSTECWCGNTKARIAKHGNAHNCNMGCAGQSAIQACGGRNAMSVYQYEGSPKSIPKDTDYLGCFADEPSERLLTLRATAHASNMSYEMCATFCKKYDATYFGVQYSTECFCGDEKDDYDRYGTAICSMKCTGDEDLVCGGSRAMNVFKIKD